MILSFHPLFEAEQNIICAGRKPNAQDLAAIQAADAVILAQGCHQSLYEMARANCPNVFPNYDARFKYPGKIGQIKLFREINVSHPTSVTFSNVATFQRQYGDKPEKLSLNFPFVFKLDWGGEGHTVFLINSMENLKKTLKRTTDFEKSGHAGFLLQEYIPSGNKTLRVVVIGERMISYWRVQKNPDGFYTNLSRGAVIESEGEPELQHNALVLITHLCAKTGINLAGFDIIFSAGNNTATPLLLEINYFFGRKGLGGSEAYYLMLQEEIRKWLKEIGLTSQNPAL